MKFFEAQKRASFAAKLFANAGLNLDTLITAGDENALKTTLGAPAAYEAMFTAAGLDPKTLAAAGPDALKLHIEGLDDSAAAAQLTTDLEAVKGTLALRDGTLNAFTEAFTAIGLADITNKTPAADVKSKFEAHVAKQTTLALAKTGHPPAHVPVAVETNTTAKSDAELYAEYQKMETGPVRLDFFTKHEAALKRAINAPKA